MKYLKLTCFIYLTATGSAFGQGPAASLADIRQEISLLNGELVDLKQELLRSSDILSRQEGLSVFGRLSEVEAQVTRLTGQSEALELRINRIVADGTNRVGDLEFRLTELEGGDQVNYLSPHLWAAFPPKWPQIHHKSHLPLKARLSPSQCQNWPSASKATLTQPSRH